MYRSPVTTRSWLVHHHRIIRRTLYCRIRLVLRLLKGTRWILVRRRILLPRLFHLHRAFGGSHDHERSGVWAVNSPWRYGEQPVDPPSLLFSPIRQGSLDDSLMWGRPGSSPALRPRPLSSYNPSGTLFVLKRIPWQYRSRRRRCCRSVFGVAIGTDSPLIARRA